MNRKRGQYSASLHKGNEKHRNIYVEKLILNRKRVSAISKRPAGFQNPFLFHGIAREVNGVVQGRLPRLNHLTLVLIKRCLPLIAPLMHTLLATAPTMASFSTNMINLCHLLLLFALAQSNFYFVPILRSTQVRNILYPRSKGLYRANPA